MGVTWDTETVRPKHDMQSTEKHLQFNKLQFSMDTPKYGETLKFVYIKYQPILVKSYYRFTKFNFGVTRTICES